MSPTAENGVDTRLPDALLGKILRHCPPDSWNTLQSVSKRWSRIVDRIMGRLLIVKSGEEYLLIDPESNLDKLSIKANFWATLSLRSDKDDFTEADEALIDSGKKVSEDPPIITNGENMRKIGFLGDFTLQSMKNIIDQCKNVRGLYLHLSVFLETNVENPEETFNISTLVPNLKELVIDSSGMNTGSKSTLNKLFNYKVGFDAVVSFLDFNKFPNLTKFLFGLPYLESREGVVVRALSAFLSKHSDTIRGFSLNQKYDVTPDSESEDDSDSEEDEEYESKRKARRTESGGGDHYRGKSSSPNSNSNCLSLKQLATNAMTLKKVSLEEIHIILIHRQETAPLWKNLILHQEKLKTCIFAGDKIPCPVSSIECNAQTLVTLRLDIREGVNLECLQNCVLLKNLTLGGKKDDHYEEDSGSSQGTSKTGNAFSKTLQLRNAICLPLSLESVDIMNLRTHKDDARFIALELPNLKELIVKNLGWEGSLGLRLKDLAEIWKMRRLEHFCIKASLNMMSYAELEKCANVSPELNLLACVIQMNSFVSASRLHLDVWKNEYGLYTTEKRGFDDIFDETMMSETDVFQIPQMVTLNEEEDESSSSESEEDDSEYETGDEEYTEDEENVEEKSSKNHKADGGPKGSSDDEGGDGDHDNVN